MGEKAERYRIPAEEPPMTLIRTEEVPVTIDHLLKRLDVIIWPETPDGIEQEFSILWELENPARTTEPWSSGWHDWKNPRVLNFFASVENQLTELARIFLKQHTNGSTSITVGETQAMKDFPAALPWLDSFLSMWMWLQPWIPPTERDSPIDPKPEKKEELPNLEDDELLTDRQREIAHFLAKGKNDKEIAVSLVISSGTVKTHRQNIGGRWKTSSGMKALQAETKRRGYGQA